MYIHKKNKRCCVNARNAKVINSRVHNCELIKVHHSKPKV